VKKAFIFSLISIIIVASFSLIFSILVNEYSALQEGGERYKAEAVNRYHEYIVNYYLPIALEDSSRSVINSMLDYVVERGSLMPSSKFQEIYINTSRDGFFSLYGYKSNASLMENHTLEYWMNVFSYNGSTDQWLSTSTNIFSEKDNLSVTLNYNTLYFSQESSWEITITGLFNFDFVSSDFRIKDDGFKVKVHLPLMDFIDPLYANKSSGEILLPIRNLTEIDNKWDLKKLKKVIPKHKFLSSQKAPSFLMRLQGNLNSSEYGIESFIDPLWVYYGTGNLTSFNDTSWRRPYMDYSFFQLSNCNIETDYKNFLYNITDLSDTDDFINFRLDFNDTVRYLGTDFDTNSDVGCKSP